jgi:uncharacterized protein YeaO (DUF488 family)
MTILLKRAYQPYDENDGFRVLVDGLWPRGVTKGAAHIDLWLKEVAPSAELRKWFGHEPERWQEFRKRYLAELRHKPDAVGTLVEHARHGKMTLVYGAKDEQHNQAVVLKGYLETLPLSATHHHA